MDQILISGLKVQAILGIDPHERITPQSVLVHITLFADLNPPALTDRIEECIDYRQVSLQVKTLIESSQHYTVEALALDILRLCLGLPRAIKARVRVEKPEALDFVERVGVEMERDRQELLG
jgi:dihydroneopterin aldolase